MVARDAYFWAWPMINVYNRRLLLKQLSEPGLMGGAMPVAPVNRLSMLSNYIQPEERMVACPNQDVVYGASTIALDESPVVIQVPDFGKRFWVYQIVDLRTDALAVLGRDVRHEARVLSARRTELEGRGAEGHRQGVSRQDQYGLRHPARVSERHAGGQQGRN